MQRHLWETKNLEEQFPYPHCGKGLLALKNYERFQTPESKRDDKEIQDNGWGLSAQFQQFYFNALLKCIRCQGDVVCIGNMIDSDYWDGVDEEPSIGQLLKPRFFLPPLKIIDIPDDTPIIIKNEIINSFELYWVNDSACGNSIRKVLERVMDEEGILRIGINRKGKPYELKLHDRIENFGKVNSKLLLAIKEIGNEGSHKKTSIEYILTAYKLLEYVIDKVYSTQDDEFTNLANKVIASFNKKKL